MIEKSKFKIASSWWNSIVYNAKKEYAEGWYQPSNSSVDPILFLDDETILKIYESVIGTNKAVDIKLSEANADDILEFPKVTISNDIINLKLQELIDIMNDEQKILAIQLIDKSIYTQSFIQKIAQNFVHETQKKSAPIGIINGWWKFVKNEFPLLYRI